MKGKVANTPQSLVCDLRGSFCFHLIRKRQKLSVYFYF